MTLNESAMALCRHPGRERRAVAVCRLDRRRGPGDRLRRGRDRRPPGRACRWPASAPPGLADVSLQPGADGPACRSRPDDPVRACLASQYAGWQIKVGKFFAMGSGPMRAAAGKEEIFDHIPGREEPPSPSACWRRASTRPRK